MTSTASAKPSPAYFLQAVIAFSIWLTSAPGSPLASVMSTCQLLSSPVLPSHC